MEMNLVDGLGYDPVKEQYFTVTYAWKNIVTNQKKSKTTTGKSGITRYDVKTAMSEAVPTRGKQFYQEALWGFECDRKYLPKDISEKDANKIVQTMDSLFKENMSDWSINTKGLGTEFYTGPVNEWLDRIKEEWSGAFSTAIMRVLGLDYSSDISTVQAMGNQGTVTEQIGEILLENNKVRSIIPCGYGKSFIMWYGIHRWEPFKDKKFIIYYCHNIPSTKQLAVKHSQYANGGDGFKRIVVCSEKKYVNGQVKYGIENYSASETKLSEILEESFKSPERVIFYVNNRSAGEFQQKFKSISKKLRLTINPGSIVDESQEFTGHKDTDKCDAVVRSISDYQVSFTATERRRGIDTNKDRIYNDDEQYFGVVANEITVSQTISEGRSCPIHFKTVEVSDNHTLMREIESNGTIETIFNDDTTLSVRGRMLRSVVCLVKSIKEDKRTHPMVVTSLIVNTHSFIRLITKLQELKIIPKSYEIVRGLRSDGINKAIEFNNHKKAIFVGTPWMVTGTDAPNTDGLIADYDMGSEITGSQWIGRGQRPVDDKELIVYIPTNPDSTEISTLLRVANKYINDENVHIESRETVIDENNIEVFGSIQRRNITTQIDRDINANPSLKVYWDKVYEDLTTNVIGRTGDYSIFLPFEEARDYMWNVGLKHSIEFIDWVKSGNKPSFIPSDASRFYENDGWLSWVDFLGVNPGWIGGKINNENEEFIRDYFNPEHISYGECYRSIDDLVDILKIGHNTIKNKCKELGIDYPGLWGKKKDSYNIKYGTAEMCREWLWSNGYDRGYDDPKYKEYIKNGGEIPKWFRTFAWVSEGNVNSRFFNKRLQNQDDSIKKMGELYSKGYSYRLLSKEFGIPKTTIAKLIKKHGFKSSVDVKTKKKMTHKLENTKQGRPSLKVDLNHLRNHIYVNKIKKYRDFKNSGYPASLETIKRIHSNFKWEDYKYND